MNVLIIDPTSSVPPYCNLLCSSLADYAGKVVLVGSDITNITIDKSKFTVYPFFHKITDISFFKKRPSIRNTIRLLFYPISLIQIYRLIKKYEIDIVHFQWSHIPILELIFIRLIRFNSKVIYTAHNTKLFHGEKFLFRRLLSIGRMRFFKKVDKIIVHTNYSKKVLNNEAKDIADNINVIPYGIEYFLTTDEINKNKTSDNVSNNITNILFFGQVSYYKGIDILIESLPFIENTKYNVSIIGRSEIDTENLISLAKRKGVDSKIDWQLKFVSNKEVHNALFKCDILVFPYRHIDQSSVLMSSLSYGKPIIASKLGGFDEILSHNINGYLFNPGSSKDLGFYLDKLVSSPKKRIIFGKNNLKLSEEWPSWKEIAKLTHDVYRD